MLISKIFKICFWLGIPLTFKVRQYRKEKGESETQRRKHQEQTQIVVIKGLDARP